MALLMIFLGLVLIFLVVARRLPDVEVLPGTVGVASASSDAIIAVSAVAKTDKKLRFPGIPKNLVHWPKYKWLKRSAVNKSSLSELPSGQPTEMVSEAPVLVSGPGIPVFHFSPEVQTLLADGDRLFDEGKMALAERRYLKAAAAEPKCVHALSRLGIIYLDETKEYADAEEAFVAALRLDPDNTYIAHNLGLVYYKRGRFTESAYYLEQSVEGGSKNAMRYCNLGICYLALRQYTRAVSALRRAVALDKGNEQMKTLLFEAKQKEDEHRAMARAVR